MHVHAVIGLADALADQGKVDEALEHLLRFVNEAPKGASLGEAFQRLEHLDYFRRPRVESVLRNWEGSPNPNLRALTLFFGARKDKVKAAISRLERFQQEHPKHFLFPAAMLKLAELYIDQRRLPEAEEILRLVSTRTANPDVHRFIAHLNGRQNFSAGDFVLAVEDFQDSSNEEDPIGFFIEAVAALYAGQKDSYTNASDQLRVDPDAEALQAELALERGLFLAARSQPGAIATLKAFTKAYPGNARMVEAEIALAELYLLEFPPKLNAANEYLARVQQRNPPDIWAEQADYVAIWVASAGRNTQIAIDAAEQYLSTWKESPRHAEMTMKLGEMYFARQDYFNARKHWEAMLSRDPDGPFAEQALFLAGKAASLTMDEDSLERAIRLWGKVVDRKGPLAEEARRQQGLVKLKQNQLEDAIHVFQRVLESKDLDTRIRMATLMNLGQAMLRKADGSIDPTGQLVPAIEIFNQVLESKDANRYWTNQAAVNKARCFERTLDDDSALEVYYEVVSQAPEAGLRQGETAEYLWYYRAGFSAINLLRRREQWGAAVKLAERLSQTGGPRAQEAREIANQLRLEHFIPWDDPLK